MILVHSAEIINRKQTERFINKITNRYGNELSGKKIAIWGLSFKPNTDDVRDAPSFKVIEKLLEKGVTLKVYDQEAMANTKNKFGDKIQYANDMYDCLIDSDALVICTEWSQFKLPNFDKMTSLIKDKLIFDGRNVYDVNEMESLGFEYYSIGRRSVNVKK